MSTCTTSGSVCACVCLQMFFQCSTSCCLSLGLSPPHTARCCSVIIRSKFSSPTAWSSQHRLTVALARLSVAVCRWYYGNINRVKAEKLLLASQNKDGSFLVRISESHSDEYTISGKWPLTPLKREVKILVITVKGFVNFLIMEMKKYPIRTESELPKSVNEVSIFLTFSLNYTFLITVIEKSLVKWVTLVTLLSEFSWIGLLTQSLPKLVNCSSWQATLTLQHWLGHFWQ